MHINPKFKWQKKNPFSSSNSNVVVFLLPRLLKRGSSRQRWRPHKSMTRRRAEPLHRPPQLPLPPHLLQKMDHSSTHHHHPQLRPPRPHLWRRPPPIRPWLPNKPRPITRHMGPPLHHTPPRHPFSLLPPLDWTPFHSPFHPTCHWRTPLKHIS